MEDTIEIVRFVEPVNFSTELENAAVKAVIVGTIGAVIAIGTTVLKLRMEKKAAKKIMQEMQEMKTATVEKD